VNRIDETFAEAKKQGRPVFIGFITAGDPKPDATFDIVAALVDGGVDIIELGVPFSDPIADGPTIQASSLRALNAGVTPPMVLEMADQISSSLNVSVVVLTYYNPIFKMGDQRFLKLAAKSGISGIVVPDLPPEESAGYRKLAQKEGIDTIYLATPSTNPQRLRGIVSATKGFLYVVPLFGVTGARESFDVYSKRVVGEIVQKVNNKVPVAVGFGISKAEHVRSFVDQGADSVIVGSAIVRTIERNLNYREKMLIELEGLAKELSSARKS
jgi:tryptophan synthase alpha chain